MRRSKKKNVNKRKRERFFFLNLKEKTEKENLRTKRKLQTCGIKKEMTEMQGTGKIIHKVSKVDIW